jgi:hypothetical protein
MLKANEAAEKNCNNNNPGRRNPNQYNMILANGAITNRSSVISNWTVEVATYGARPLVAWKSRTTTNVLSTTRIESSIWRLIFDFKTFSSSRP